MTKRPGATRRPCRGDTVRATVLRTPTDRVVRDELSAPGTPIDLDHTSPPARAGEGCDDGAMATPDPESGIPAKARVGHNVHLSTPVGMVRDMDCDQTATALAKIDRFHAESADLIEQWQALLDETRRLNRQLGESESGAPISKPA